MDDEKKTAPDGGSDLSTNKQESSDFSLFKPDESAAVVHAETDGRQEKRNRRKQEKMKKSGERKRKYPNPVSFLLGAVILIFAVIGVVLIVWNSVSYIKKTTDKGSGYGEYESFLTPIAAVDVDSFDDISDADPEQLLNAAIWVILSNSSTPDTYEYSGGCLLVPSRDVESAYTSLFGADASSHITHQTVQGYNCTFEYSDTAMVYRIPITTINPVYTPEVTEVKKTGTTLTVTVNYLAFESWRLDDSGNYAAPAPDKIIQVTLRESGGVYYISSIRTVSATIPETIPYDAPETPSDMPDETAAETTAAETATAARNPEKTTLGGRVY